MFRCASVLLALIAFEGGSRLAIRLLPGHDLRPTSEILADQSRTIAQLLDASRSGMIEIHPKLGWRYAANFKNGVNQLNTMALRSTREYSEKPRANVLRVAAFGDSYVYGSEVDNANAWEALMEAADPDLEVLNYGVGGYGVDQAYLRYLSEGSELRPRVVMMGFTPDDIGRVVNVYRRFIGSQDLVLFKPRYLIDDQDELTLVDAPLRNRQDYARLLANPRDIVRYGELDYWYRAAVYENPLYEYSAAMRLGSWLWDRAYRRHRDPERLYNGEVFSTTSKAFRINLAVLTRFVAAVSAAGAQPVIVMLPDPESVQAARSGKPSRYQPLLERLVAQRIPVLDVAEAFRRQPQQVDSHRWFAPQGHYSAAGNRIVADWLGPAIQEYARRVTSRQ